MATRYQVSLERRSQLIAVRDQQLPARGLYVPATSKPALFSQQVVTVAFADGAAMQISGQVVNSVPTGFYLLIDGVEQIQFLGETVRAAIAALPEDAPAAEDAAVEDAAADGSAAANAEPGDAGPAPVRRRPVKELVNFGSDVPISRQIAELDLEDRLRLAPVANRSMRRALARDPNKDVHLEVIQNPRLTDDEALEFAGLTGFSPVALQWLSEQEQYAGRTDILMAIATNPGTPPEMARLVLDALAHNELYLILRSTRCREATKREARRRLVKAGAL